MPSGNKPLPEPQLTQICVAIWCPPMQFAVRSLQFVRRLGSLKWNLWMPNFQISYSDLASKIGHKVSGRGNGCHGDNSFLLHILTVFSDLHQAEPHSTYLVSSVFQWKSACQSSRDPKSTSLLLQRWVCCLLRTSWLLSIWHGKILTKIKSTSQITKVKISENVDETQFFLSLAGRVSFVNI